MITREIRQRKELEMDGLQRARIQRLKAVKEEKGWSWAELGQFFGINPNTMINIKRGRAKFKAAYLEKIHAVLEEDLFFPDKENAFQRLGVDPHQSPRGERNLIEKRSAILRETRIKSGLSTSQFARVFGMPRETMRDHLIGKGPISSNYLRLYSEALQESGFELTSEEEKLIGVRDESFADQAKFVRAQLGLEKESQTTRPETEIVVEPEEIVTEFLSEPPSSDDIEIVIPPITDDEELVSALELRFEHDKRTIMSDIAVILGKMALLTADGRIHELVETDPKFAADLAETGKFITNYGRALKRIVSGTSVNPESSEFIQDVRAILNSLRLVNFPGIERMLNKGQKAEMRVVLFAICSTLTMWGKTLGDE